MAVNRILILIFIIAHGIHALSQQTFWKVENEYGDEILLTIEMNKEKNTFEAFTRKDALKDIAGTFTYTMAKAAGKLKYPEIVFIEGNTQTKKDTIKLTGTFTYFDKQFPFSAAIYGNQFKGSYIDRNRPRLLEGTKMPSDNPINNYPAVINTVFSLTEKNLANPDWIKSDEWIDFKTKINELKPKIADDYELAASMQWLGKKLPFTSFEINRINPHPKPAGKRNEASFREINPKTILFNANSLPATKTEMDSISAIVNKKGYKNLILDVRGRNSVNPVVVNLFANFISKKAFIAGAYITRKWFENHANISSSDSFDKLFRSFTESGYVLNTLYKEQGRTLKIVPVNQTFMGKIYVLTDSKTSKSSEVLVHILKTEKMAIVVGQKTSGNSFLTERLPVSNEFELILPVADFYTATGKALKREGIEPDIAVSNEDALQYVLKTLP